MNTSYGYNTDSTTRTFLKKPRATPHREKEGAERRKEERFSCFLRRFEALPLLQ